MEDNILDEILGLRGMPSGTFVTISIDSLAQVKRQISDLNIKGEA